MAGFFLDTSALVKRYHVEEGTAEMDRLFDDPRSVLVVSRLSLVELLSAQRHPSALFGWGHGGGQGLTGALPEGFAGFLLGPVYLGCRRNLIVPIVAHGVSNTLAFVLIFFDRYPGV